MKSFLVALFLLLTPFNALAQNPPEQHSKAKKLEWIGIGALAGGISGTVIGIATGKSTQEVFTYLQSGTCSTFQSSSSTASTCVTFVTGSTTQVGTTTGTITFSTQQHRATNWKIAGPAIGAAGAGALMMELGHLQVKRAELSIRPDGALRVAFKW
jgi:hypothetical protein